MRDNFNIYRNTLEALEQWPPETAMKAISYIGHYAMDGVVPDNTDAFAYGLFLQVKPVIDKSNARAEAGRAGGEATSKQTEANVKQNQANLKQTEANVKQTEAKPSINIKEENINNKSIKNKDILVRFTAPTAQDVRDYAAEKGLTIDADKFVDFYESKGWLVGKVKMKDWKAAVRNWARSDVRQGRAAEVKKNSFSTMPQRQYDMSELERKLLGL